MAAIEKNLKPTVLAKTDPGKHFWRIRLLPVGRPRRPLAFWNSEWCYYEIGAGEFPPPARSSEVQFFMACNNKECGKQGHASSVRGILESVAAKRKDARFRYDWEKEFAFLSISAQRLDPV